MQQCCWCCWICTERTMKQWKKQQKQNELIFPSRVCKWLRTLGSVSVWKSNLESISHSAVNAEPVALDAIGLEFVWGLFFLLNRYIFQLRAVSMITTHHLSRWKRNKRRHTQSKPVWRNINGTDESTLWTTLNKQQLNNGHINRVIHLTCMFRNMPVASLTFILPCLACARGKLISHIHSLINTNTNAHTCTLSFHLPRGCELINDAIKQTKDTVDVNAVKRKSFALNILPLLIACFPLQL